MQESKLQYIIIILLLQSLLLLTFWSNIKSETFDIANNDNLLGVILFITIGLSILSIIMVKELFRLIQKTTEYKIQQVKLEESEKLIKSLRSQKHDFANHLQTIYGMVQLNKEGKVKEYIRGLNKDLSSIQLHKTEFSDSILDSILVPKKLKAMKAGLQFEKEVDSGIEAIDAPIDKIFRIISNLIDNAIDATKEFEGSNKQIKVEGRNMNKQYIVSVYNSGPIIDDELLDMIFEPGFSTKGDGRGFGLYIIKTLVEEVQGELEVKSEKNYGTEFICHFPTK